MNTFEVIIPTFVNPHLFWVLKSKNEEETKELHRLMRDVKIKEPDLDTSFEVGEIVAVNYNKYYRRAIIEDIQDEKDQGFVYLCWLIDYGTMFEASSVCKLPAHVRKTKPLAMQASLNNVVYLQQHLMYDENSGQPKKFVEYVTTPTSIAHQVSLELMLYAKNLRFELEDKVDGILLGDVLFEKDGESKSLRQELIDKGVLIINDILFHEIQENIYTYKETHLFLIVQICKKLNWHCVLEENANKSECQKIISKYLEEFDNRDLFDDDEVLQPFKVRRNRRKQVSVDSSNNTLHSENDSISDGDVSKKLRDVNGSNNSSNMSDKKNRSKMLLEKLKRQHQKSMEEKSDNVTDDDSHQSDNKENEISSKDKTAPRVNAKQKLMEYFKAKKRDMAAKEDKDDSSNSVEKESSSDAHVSVETSDVAVETPTVQPKKRAIPRNVIFQPGGASFTLKNTMVTSTPKSRKPKNDEKLSSEDTDSRTKKMSTERIRDRTVVSDDASTTEESKSDTQATPSSEPFQPAAKLNVKPHCSCKQCEHWTHESDWKTNIPYGSGSKSHILPLEKPPTFFRDEKSSNAERRIISLDYSSVTKVQKQAMLKLIVHGEYSPRLTKLVFEVAFNKDIHKTLQHLEYKEAKQIQAYGWPGIFRSQHVCMISGPQTGKTMAYLPIMLTFLLEKTDRYEALLKAGGPIFIVLCTNSKKCEDVYDLAKIILGRNRAKVSLITYPLTHVNTRHIDFLVTTPAVLVDLIKANAITLKRLCHLILEDGDKILNHDTEITKVFSLIQNMLQHRVCLKPVQLVICAEHWTTRIETLLKKLDTVPLICIGNYLEAALYGKMQFSMRFVNSACKEHELKSLLKDTHKVCKSVIVCKNEEIEDIQTILMLKGIDATVLTEDMSKENILYLEEVWTSCKAGQYTVLVCTDFLLNTLLTVTSASLLIHYSLPFSWTKFVKRFSCLLENVQSPFNSKESKIKCQSVVLCDEECEEHMLKFFRFIDTTELKYQLPEKFQAFSKDLKNLEEDKKIKSEVGLCDTLKLFGSCLDPQCVRRHMFDKNLDVLTHLPQSGKIKFKIVHIQDVTTYSIELVQHVDMDDKVHEFDDILDVTEDLTDAMKISRKRIVVPVIGHLYAYYNIDELEGVYYRCELLEIDNECVKIKLLDRGSIVSTVKSRLYRLPKEFKDTSKPRKIYDAILANLLPPYGDEHFSARSFFHLKNLLQKYDYQNIILTGDVHLQLGNTLWLKEVHQEVVLTDKVVPGFRLTREILQSKLAIYSKDQLASLYNLCDKASIQLPKYEKDVVRTVKKETNVEPQWAHLHADEVGEVIFSAAVSPGEIYFRLYKFNSLLYALQKEIQENIRKPNYPKLKNVEVGTICLAQDVDGQYGRVIVLKTEVTDSGGRARCFFVDFGDEAIVDIPNLKHIHSKFITKLPFQTIQCKLHGIKPNLDEWQQEALDILYEYAMEPNTDIFRSLYVLPCWKENNHVIPRQNRYSVLLKDGFGEKKALINSLLVDCGMAILDPDVEVSNFEIPESASESNEPEEELERMLDICRKTDEVDGNFVHNKSENAVDKMDPNYDDMELFLIDSVEFFKQVLSNKPSDLEPSNPKPPKMEPLNSEPNRIQELPTPKVLTPVDYCTPDVWWSQTETMVKIDIKLHDVEHYTLNLTKGRSLNFKTIHNEKTYILKLMLYEKVETVQHTAMGPQVRVKLTKSKEIEWPRLILAKQIARNIHYDASTLNVEEKRKKFLELPRGSDDSEPDDDNIDIMYHVWSDMDSDFDLEMPNDSD